MLWRQQRTTYSRAEWIADAVVHGVGLVLLAVAVPILLLLTALRHQKGPALAGVSVYALGLVAMFAASAAYNIVSGVRRGKAWAWLLKRLDHAAIYVKIAGTYTPFAVLTGQGWRLALVVWVGALAGVVLKLFSPDRLRWLALALDLALGWAGLVFGKELIAALPSFVIGPMVVGGVLYTLGVGFYLWERLPFHLTLWHAVVLVASFCFYSAVLAFVVSSFAAHAADLP